MLTSSSFVFGVVVGLILVAGLLRFANMNRKQKTEYDERQKEVRGRGYMLGFYTLMIYEALTMFLTLDGIELPVKPYILHFFGIILGGLVLASYCIWNDAYWGLNNNRKRYTAIIVVAIALNIIPVITSIANGTLAKEGFNSLPLLNVIVLIWMAVIGICALVKKAFDAKENEED